MGAKSDKKAILIIFSALSVIAFIGFLLYTANPQNTLGISTPEKVVSQLVDFTDCMENVTETMCYDQKYIDNKKIEIKYIKADRVDYKKGIALYINDEEIVSPKSQISRISNNLYVTKNTVIFASYEAGVKNIKIYIYDFKGNKLKEVYKIDEEKNILVDDYKFEDGKVLIKGLKHIESKSVVLYQEGESKYVIQNADICQEYLANKDLSAEDIYSANYTIEYLTSLKLGEIKMVPGTKVTLYNHLKEIGCDI